MISISQAIQSHNQRKKNKIYGTIFNSMQTIKNPNQILFEKYNLKLILNK
jgi:hypothetical protein